MDLRTALARSCNTFFYELGKRLNDRDPNLLPNTAKSFGLGKATDIDFVLEAEGIVPSPEWKQQYFSRPADQVWNPGDATNLAIGQGYLLATPLQMANYAATLANDGIVWKPRLVIELRDRDGTSVKTYPKTQAGSVLSIPTRGRWTRGSSASPPSRRRPSRSRPCSTSTPSGPACSGLWIRRSP